MGRDPGGVIPRLLLGCLLLLAMTGGARAQGGTTGVISGRLFTADHPESLAAGAEVALVWQAGDKSERRETQAAGDGSYHFHGLSTDGAIAYVLQVRFRGEGFLGAPVHFAPGQSVLDLSFLVTPTAPPFSEKAPSGEMPPSHPDISGSEPEGKPVPVNPRTTLLIVIIVVAVFVAPAAWLARRDAARSAPGLPVGAGRLVRDIASLDARFDAGQLEREDYEKVRASLLNQLRNLTGISSDRAAGA